MTQKDFDGIAEALSKKDKNETNVGPNSKITIGVVIAILLFLIPALWTGFTWKFEVDAKLEQGWTSNYQKEYIRQAEKRNKNLDLPTVDEIEKNTKKY